MIKMQRIQAIVKRAFAPVTIMLIPHHKSGKSIHLNISLLGVVFSLMLCGGVAVYLVLATIDIVGYRSMDKQIREYSARISDFNATMASLKKAEKDLYRLLAMGSREKVLEAVDPSDMGRVDINTLEVAKVDMGTVDINQVRKQIAISMQTIGALQDFLQSQKDIYVATPRGWPVDGNITSPYGRRFNPFSGRMEVHRGVDIAVPGGTPILSTADGVVSFAGWNGGGGNVIVIEHGLGYSTYYAHNRENIVQVGQKVKRGECIGYAGRTGNATGSHVHYEIWRNDNVLNPRAFMQGRS
jgi:murein DD-endopeptidase MepM/ murein hydrolase activator NlpD